MKRMATRQVRCKSDATFAEGSETLKPQYLRSTVAGPRISPECVAIYLTGHASVEALDTTSHA